MQVNQSAEQIGQRREALTVTVLKVAWLAVGLALGVELILLMLTVLLHGESSSTNFVSELAKKITWSVPVCVALTIGKIASRSRPAVVGAAGFLMTPVAFQVATVVQQTVTRTLGGVVSGSVGLIVIMAPLVKAVEYGALGAALASAGRQESSAVRHVLIGLGIGLAAGAALAVLLLVSGPGSSPADLLSTGLNETLIAGGCAGIVYVIGTLLGLKGELESVSNDGNPLDPS